MRLLFEVTAAKAKTPPTDAPDKESMRTGTDKIRRAPSTDQKRVRREMAKKASSGADEWDNLVAWCYNRNEEPDVALAGDYAGHYGLTDEQEQELCEEVRTRTASLKTADEAAPAGDPTGAAGGTVDTQEGSQTCGGCGRPIIFVGGGYSHLGGGYYNHPAYPHHKHHHHDHWGSAWGDSPSWTDNGGVGDTGSAAVDPDQSMDSPDMGPPPGPMDPSSGAMTDPGMDTSQSTDPGNNDQYSRDPKSAAFTDDTRPLHTRVASLYLATKES